MEGLGGRIGGRILGGEFWRDGPGGEGSGGRALASFSWMRWMCDLKPESKVREVVVGVSGILWKSADV